MTRRRKRLMWWLTFVVATLFFSLAIPVIIDGKAIAHDWYPSECCSGVDCAPVSATGFVQPPAVGVLGPPSAHASTPLMSVTTPRGTVVVPPNFRRRESKDNGLHACIAISDGVSLYGDAKGQKAPPKGTPYLRCIFYPPAT